MRRKNLRRIIFVYLNISSLRSKSDALVDQIKGNVDILVVSETKLDESFLEGQFKLPGFTSPFPRDRNEFGSGIMVFVRKDIPYKVISKETLSIEEMFIELNFRKKKWLLSCSCNPKYSRNIHLEILRRNLDLYSVQYEILILKGDFNTDINHSCMKTFCESYASSSLTRNQHVKKMHRILHALI